MADATPLVRAAQGQPASLRFRLASGPRKGTWWHATAQLVELSGAKSVAVVVFRRVPGPSRPLAAAILSR